MSERLSDEQIAFAFTSVTGVPPRGADIGVVSMLGGMPEQLAEYIWDHWLGEPEQPTLAQVEGQVIEAVHAQITADVTGDGANT